GETSSRCCRRLRRVASRRLLGLAFSPAVFPESSSLTWASYVTRARLCYIWTDESNDQLPPFLPCAVPQAGDQARLDGPRRGGREGGPSIAGSTQVRPPLRRPGGCREGSNAGGGVERGGGARSG